MRELTLRVENPRIKINGAVFALCLSDAELYLRAQTLFAGFAARADAPLTGAEVAQAARDARLAPARRQGGRTGWTVEYCGKRECKGARCHEFDTLNRAAMAGGFAANRVKP